MDDPLSAPHAAFVLLAEFNIDSGSGLKHQYPQPTGTDELMLADLMLPDGAHDRTEDWTVFFLNQTAALTVRPPGSVKEGNGPAQAQSDAELLYVISLVRTKKDTTVRRGAVCKAMAICSRHPFIQIFKPVLLLALEDYFADPSIDCLARLYQAINAMDTTGMPVLSTRERIILRSSDRKDVFEERFEPVLDRAVDGAATPSGSLQNNGSSEQSSVKAFDDASGSDHVGALDGSDGYAIDPGHLSAAVTSGPQPKRPKDTHWFDTKIQYVGMSIPVRIPLQTFPGEIGEYSLIKLIQTFSSPNALPPNTPMHPHLHSSGPSTHPIILLFNALVTEKRILFLGHGQPAGVVAEYVLAACALGSGCGTVLEGFAARAFPYSNLTIYEDFQAVPGYIAGVTNPIFELHSEAWDVFCNIETGRISLSKDIVIPANSPLPFSPPALERTMTEASGGDSTARSTSAGEGAGVISGTKSEGGRESMDNVFMDEILSAIQAHFGENVVRARFSDYAQRFVRLASRYEEVTNGRSSIGPASKSWSTEGLGSGIVFADDAAAKRELAANSHRIEGWHLTGSYKRYQKRATDGSLSCLRFDAQHQLARLRQARRMPDGEVEMLFQTLLEDVRSDAEIIELLSQMPPHLGGLLPLAFGVLHPSNRVRLHAVDFLKRLDAHPTGNKFCQNLNAFHRLAFLRQDDEQSGTGFSSAWTMMHIPDYRARQRVVSLALSPSAVRRHRSRESEARSVLEQRTSADLKVEISCLFLLSRVPDPYLGVREACEQRRTVTITISGSPSPSKFDLLLVPTSDVKFIEHKSKRVAIGLSQGEEARKPRIKV